MSTESDCLQVHTDVPERTLGSLRDLGFSGFVFRGTGGWLTVVPYGGPAGLIITTDELTRFAARIARPVVHYQSNDFGWLFVLALPDGQTTGFTRIDVDMTQWGLPAQPPDPAVNEAVLSVVVPVARVRTFLHPSGPAAADGMDGDRFAEAMGFPQFTFLSPHYAMDDPAEMRRRGGIEIGSRPASMPGHASP